MTNFLKRLFGGGSDESATSETPGPAAPEPTVAPVEPAAPPEPPAEPAADAGGEPA